MTRTEMPVKSEVVRTKGHKELNPVVLAAAIVAIVLGTGDVLRHVISGKIRDVKAAVPVVAKKLIAVNIAEPGLCPYKWSMSDDFDVSSDPDVLIPRLLDLFEKYEKQLAALKALKPYELHISAEDAACEYKRIRETMDEISSLISVARAKIERQQMEQRKNTLPKTPDTEYPDKDDGGSDKDSSPAFLDSDVAPS